MTWAWAYLFRLFLHRPKTLKKNKNKDFVIFDEIFWPCFSILLPFEVVWSLFFSQCWCFATVIIYIGYAFEMPDVIQAHVTCSLRWEHFSTRGQNRQCIGEKNKKKQIPIFIQPATLKLHGKNQSHNAECIEKSQTLQAVCECAWITNIQIVTKCGFCKRQHQKSE